MEVWFNGEEGNSGSRGWRGWEARAAGEGLGAETCELARLRCTDRRGRQLRGWRSRRGGGRRRVAAGSSLGEGWRGGQSTGKEDEAAEGETGTNRARTQDWQEAGEWAEQGAGLAVCLAVDSCEDHGNYTY